MSYELKMVVLKLTTTLLLAPVMGWIIMRSIESLEKAWKTNNKRKKWLACCGCFIIFAAIDGWFL